VVILDNGLRADVVGTQRNLNGDDEEEEDGSKTPSGVRPASFFAPENIDDNDAFEAIERRSGVPAQADGSAYPSVDRLVPHVALPPDRQHHLPDEEIRDYIMKQLPPGSQATIRTDTVTARTITVDVFDHDDIDISPPPGTDIIEERFNNLPDTPAAKDSLVAVDQLPKHTVVFRTVLNQSHTADLRREQQEDPAPDRFLWHKRRGKDATWQPPQREALRMSSTDHLADESSTVRAATLPRKRSLRSPSSSSSLSGSETPKASFGKSSLSKFRKMKANTEEKLGKISRGLAQHGPGGETPRPRKENVYLKGPASTTVSTTAPALTRRHTVAPDTESHSTSKASSSFGSADRKRPPLATIRRRSSGGSYYSVHEESRESYVAQTDAYSRPSSPTATRNFIHSTSSLTPSKSDKDLSLRGKEAGLATGSAHHRRSKSLVASVYSIAATSSNTSLLLAPRAQKSVFEDQATISALSRDGRVPGLFPSKHLAENVLRFCRFSSASYGANFLRVMGISTNKGSQDWRKSEMDDHHEHSSFSDHTGLPASTILLSSFVDPAGGSNSSGETAEGFPLVHFLSLDHDSKAVVLTLRGTWGFEDILTDMTCDYDDLYWMGRAWQVHKGMHASARRLLEGGGGRVMATTRAALEKFPDYGVIFCGHSLGGGVAALLATLLSRPKDRDQPGPMFVTASEHATSQPLLPSTSDSKASHQQQQRQRQPRPFCLPAGRPIHVYAYGPPAVMSPALRRATRGLITTVVNGQDVVPTLSLGILRDLHAVSLAFKNDVAEAKSYVRSRVWERITHSIVNSFYMNQPPILIHAGDGVGEDSWAWTTLKSLRENLTSTKLLPPGEVFVVETMRVLQRDAFTATADSFGTDGSPRLGRPASRVQLKYIRDVEARFREIRFGSGMFGDHSPARYEASLTVLARGVLED
jgi:hypothetical protein